MPIKDFCSNKEKWQEIANNWNRYKQTPFENLQAAVTKAQSIADTVNAYNDPKINTVSFPLTQDDIMRCFEHCKKMWNLANGFHEEADELIDLPFSTAMGEILEQAVALNPSEIHVRTGWFSGTSLTDLVATVITDEELKKDFESKVAELDDDAIPYELQDAIIDAQFWQQQYIIAGRLKAVVEKHFPQEIIDAWAKMSPQERENVIRPFADDVGLAYGADGCFNVVMTLQFGNGTVMTDYVMQLSEGFLTKEGVTATAYDVIDAVIHEGRHGYQNALLDGFIDIPMTPAIREAMADYKKPTDTDPETSADEEFRRYYFCGKEYDARAMAALVVSRMEVTP